MWTNYWKKMVVQGVAYDLNTAKVTVFDIPDQPGTAGKLWCFGDEKINVNMII